MCKSLLCIRTIIFRTIRGGSNVSIVEGANDITISATGGGGGGGSDNLRVVVIGDSMSAQQELIDPCWPTLLEKMMAGRGAKIELLNLSINGNTAFRAVTNTPFGGLSAVDTAITLGADIVIVALGLNDAVIKNDARTIGQVQTDMTTLFTNLRAGLPTAAIVYASELAYDKSNFTPAALKNKGTLPLFMQKKTTGILTGSYTSEILEDLAQSTYRTGFADWETLDAHVRGLTSINGSFTLNIFRAVRLGCIGPDALHLKASGHNILAGYAIEAFRTIGALSTLTPALAVRDYPIWQDPDTLFTSLTDPSADGYVNAAWTGDTHAVLSYWGTRANFNVDTWYMPTGGIFKVNRTTLSGTRADNIAWVLTNARALSAVTISLDGASFGSSGITTDYRGDAIDVGPGDIIASGTRTLRYKVGDEVYGPFTYTVNTTPTAYVRTRQSSTYVATKAAFTDTVFNTEEADRTSSMSSTTFTAPVAGLYHVRFSVTVDNITTGGLLIPAIASAGSNLLEGATQWSNFAAPYTGEVNGTLLLTQGQTLTFKYYVDGTGTINIITGPRGRGTMVTISYIGP